MSWITTYTGKRFYPLEPSEEMIDIEDIAWGLSNKCRFNGQCRFFYSVAAHSIILSRLLPPKYKLWGLLHDAAEAYLPDVCSPIKPYLSGFQELENNILKLIAKKFNLYWPIPEEVMKTDKMLGINEYLHLHYHPDNEIQKMELTDLKFSNMLEKVNYFDGLKLDVYEVFLTEIVNLEMNIRIE